MKEGKLRRLIAGCGRGIGVGTAPGRDRESHGKLAAPKHPARRRAHVLAATALAAGLVMGALPAIACSLVYIVDTKSDGTPDGSVPKFVVRTMDLPPNPPSPAEDAKLLFFPRNLAKDSSQSILPKFPETIYGSNGVPLAIQNPLTWTSKYSSVGMVSYNTTLSDGVNEMGLAGHLLVLDVSSDLPSTGLNQKTLGQNAWLSWVLDNFSSVQQVVTALAGGSGPRLVLAHLKAPDGEDFGRKVHLSVEDPTGDMAIFETVGGQMQVYQRNRTRNFYPIMTNDPPYRIMLQDLPSYAGFGGTQVVPGDVQEGLPRFLRLATYLAQLEPMSATPGFTYQDVVARAISLIRVTQVPFLNRYFPLEVTWLGSRTNWLTAIDVNSTAPKYYFISSTGLNLAYLDFSDPKLNPNRPFPLWVDPNRADLVGNVSGQLRKWSP